MKKPKTSFLDNSKANSLHLPNWYPNASSNNLVFLKKTLRLLGITEEQLQKETKCSFLNDFFPKTLPNPTNSKQFFFICFVCAKGLFEQENGQLSMWYPPRTVNEQLQFKKVLFKLLQKWQAEFKVPKQIILSRASFMGDASTSSVLQFLRTLSELSLRAVYIRKYSKTQRLIQISVNQYTTTIDQMKSPENDINKFYVFPFCQTATTVEPPVSSSLQLEEIKRIFKIHIQRLRKDILSLRTEEETQRINPQSVMSQILEQKQLNSTLLNKVSKSIYTENRAFDRRVIIQKHEHVWGELASVKVDCIESGEEGVLQVEGEADKRLRNWKAVAGAGQLGELTVESQKLAALRGKCGERLQQLKKLKHLLAATVFSATSPA